MAPTTQPITARSDPRPRRPAARKAPLPAWLGETEPRDRHAPRLRFRTVFISDTHLGTPGCNAALLLDFLKSIECETLYLVGDIVDGWQLRKGWYWPAAHNDVVRCVLKMAKRGARVIYIPGNHDEAFRDFTGLHFGDVELLPEDIHVTADGRRLLVLHGDQFDSVVMYARWLAFLGDSAYTMLLKSNALVNGVRKRFGLPYWSARRASQEARQECGRVHLKNMRRSWRRRRPNAMSMGLSAGTSIPPRSASSARSRIIMTAIGSRAARRWSNMPTARWRSSTGPSAVARR